MICKHIQIQMTSMLKTRDNFWRKELQLQLLKGLCDTGSPSCAPPDPTDPIVHGCWKYLTNISQIFCKCCTNTLQFHKKYITNMLRVKLLALWHRIPLLGRHLIQLHHATRPLQLHIRVCNFFSESLFVFWFFPYLYLSAQLPHFCSLTKNTKIFRTLIDLGQMKMRY